MSWIREFISKVASLVRQAFFKATAILAPFFVSLHAKLKPVCLKWFARAKAVLIPFFVFIFAKLGFLQRWFSKINAITAPWLLKLKQKSIALYQEFMNGVIAQKTIAYIATLKVRINDFITHSEWAGQLRDASEYGARFPTFVATFFVNILALAFPMMMMQIYDRIIPNRTYATLTILSLGVICALLVEVTLRIARSYVDLWSDTKYEYELSKTAFGNLINAPLYVYEERDVGARLKQFAVLDQMRGFYNNQLLVAIYDIPFLIIFLITIGYIGGLLFLIPVVVGAATAYLSFHFIQKWKYLLEEKISHESKEGNFIINVLSGIHTVKSLGMEDLLLRRYERLQNTGILVNYHSSVQSEGLSVLKATSNQLVTILTATFGSFYVINGDMAIGGLAACILLVGRVMQPINRIMNASNRWNMLNIIRAQLDSVLRLPVEDKTFISGFGELKGEIAFRDLSFYFEDKTSHWILKNITITIPPRTVVSIIGDRQSDKTALLNIIATIAKPTSGEYLLDGHDVDHYQTYELREQIAYLSKSGKLFRGTMMDNLSAFNEELIPVARRFVDTLGLNKIISKLPAGFDTMVGDKAVEALPGGVINLIFIIRALVNKPKIILFDEANVNLDTQSNKKMIELLATLKEIATIIIIASSEETIALSDVVYNLKGGQLIKVEKEEKHAE